MAGTNRAVARRNRAWISAYFGCGIGAGILFIPIQAGQGGVYECIVIMLIAFFVMFFAQKYFTIVLARSKTNQGFDKAVEDYLGKKSAPILSVLYILIMFAGIIAYSTAINTSIPELLMQFNLTESNLSKNPWFTLILLSCITVFPMISQRFLLKVMERMSQMLFVLLIIIGFMFIPLWNLTMFTHYSFSWYGLFKNFLLCFPIFLYSAIYYPTITPMVTDYKTDFPDMAPEESEKNMLFITKWSSIILSSFIMLFTISAVLALTPESLERAIQQNTSTLAVIGHGEENISWFIYSARMIGAFTLISALMTSYYGSVLGIVDTAKGFCNAKYAKLVEIVTNILMALILYFIVICNFNVLGVIGMFETPIIGLIVFIFPVIIFYMKKQFKDYKGIGPIIIALSGLFIMFSFLVGRIL